MRNILVLGLVLAIVLIACKAPEKTNYNYCSSDDECNYYWSGYESKVCPVCDIADERWTCINRYERNVLLSDMLEKDALPKNCEKCTLQVEGHSCKCSRGVCVKK